MDPALIVAAIRAAIGLADAGSAAYKQHERDAAALFPEPVRLSRDADTLIRSTFGGTAGAQLLAGRDLGPLWSGLSPDYSQVGAYETLHVAAVEIAVARHAAGMAISDEQRREEVGVLLIEQWREGEGPVSPLGRMIVTLADVALEFVAVHPSVMGAGGNGEKLIGALAANLAEMIPDDADAWGPRRRFAERLLAGFLRAGLQSLAEHPDLLLEEEQLQKLVGSSLPPLVQGLPEDLATQVQWREALSALVGPTASAAMRTIAEHPTAFLGSRFDAGEAVGAVAQAVLREVAEAGLADSLSRAGWLGILRAAMGVAAERPELFVRGGATRDGIARDLVGGIAGVLRDADPDFPGGLGIALAQAVLAVAEQHAAAFLDAGEPWEALVSGVLRQLIGGLGEGLAEGRIEQRFSARQLTEIARVFLEQAAQTPHMLAGDSELQAVIAAVTAAMAPDEELLLSHGDWLEIARVAAREAATNPGRLFGEVSEASGDPMGTAIITGLLEAAALDRDAGGRGRGGVFFGETLRRSIVVTLQAASGQVRAAIENEEALQKLAVELAALVREQSDRLGSQEWLQMFQILLESLLAGEEIPVLTMDVAETLLTEGTLA
jgi:hypothetical protein